MKYSLYAVAILLVVIISFIYASDRMSYNNCMDRVKLDYISKRGADHIAAQCKAFVLDKVMAN